jgi:hypothetical protein
MALDISAVQTRRDEEIITFDVEGVLHFAGRMLLRHKHGVKVPEGRFNETVGGHLGEPFAMSLISRLWWTRQLTQDRRRFDGTLPGLSRAGGEHLHRSADQRRQSCTA